MRYSRILKENKYNNKKLEDIYIYIQMDAQIYTQKGTMQDKVIMYVNRK